MVELEGLLCEQDAVASGRLDQSLAAEAAARAEFRAAREAEDALAAALAEARLKARRDIEAVRALGARSLHKWIHLIVVRSLLFYTRSQT